MKSTSIPSKSTLDHTFSLLNDGYTFIEKRCRENHTDLFETRLLGEKVVCLHGKEAASIFYDTEKFKRKGVTPKRIQKTLFGQKGVQSLDKQAHKHRKEAFMSLMKPEAIDELMTLIRAEWQLSLQRWESMERLVLFDETRDILCKAVCEWSGVPLAREDVEKRAKDLSTMVDGFGGVGVRNWEGRTARNRSEKWIASLIEQTRKGELQIKENTALALFSHHQDLEGKLLDKQIAAVEVLNIIRPVVAIAWYDTFLGLALFQYPQYREKLQQGNEQDMENFVQEVRRFYPFTPFVGARVLNEFDWRGYHFPKDRLVLLDVYGTNRDDVLWERAEVFWPERFEHWDESKFDFIPQGGGDFITNHRCAGEWITIAAMKVALDQMVNHMEYEVPEQDFSYDLSRMPSIPNSRFIMQNVRAVV